MGAYGVSVEKVEEALKAIEYPGVATVQIIFNIFRQRPAELFFEQARRRDVGVIARVPLASGLLTGKLTRETRSPPDDHRSFNRHGEAFDVGETFAGVDFELGLEVVDELEPLVPTARRSRSSRCAGSSTSPRSRPSSREQDAGAGEGERPCRGAPAAATETTRAISELYRNRIARSGASPLVARAQRHPR